MLKRFLPQRFNKEHLASSLNGSVVQIQCLKRTKSQKTDAIKKEIIELLKDKQEQRAQVSVERLIQEDNMLVAMEQIQLLCELLYNKIGLIQANRDLEQSLNEAVVTLLWASPHLEVEVTKLKEVSNQLSLKYSSEFANQCRANRMGTVNKLVIEKLAAKTPSRPQVDEYLSNIAKGAGLDCQPARAVMVGSPGNIGTYGYGRKARENAQFPFPEQFVEMPPDNFDYSPPRPSEGAGLPYPEQNGFPDVGKIMKEMKISSPTSKGPDISDEPYEELDLPPLRFELGFKVDVLKDSQEIEDENLPDVTSAQPKNSGKTS